jgi:ferredoxin-like protein FixX
MVPSKHLNFKGLNSVTQWRVKQLPEWWYRTVMVDMGHPHTRDLAHAHTHARSNDPAIVAAPAEGFFEWMGGRMDNRYARCVHVRLCVCVGM